jgi:hypothetical protein
LKKLARQTGINTKTAETWRARLMRNPKWRPYYHRNIHRRALTPEQEEWLAARIRAEFIADQKYCPAKQLSLMAMRIKRGLDCPCGSKEEEEDVYEEPDRIVYTPGHEPVSRKLSDDEDEEDLAEEEFPEEEEDGKGRKPRGEFTAKWRRAFLRRQGLALRKARPEKRSIPNDEFVAMYLSQLEAALQKYGPARIFNMDETSLPVTRDAVKTIANRGAESVKVKGRGAPKKRLTMIGTVSAAGDKLPPWIICKGTTTRCERIMRADFAEEIAKKQLFITHSPQGWVDQTVALQYVNWLRKFTAIRGPFVLVWDVFAAHRDKMVVASAFEDEVQLIFVPAGQTGEWQPLDKRVFGELKGKINERYDDDHIRDPNVEESPRRAVRYMLDTWKGITQENVLNAWKGLF